jgi:hypothetical protein
MEEMERKNVNRGYRKLTVWALTENWESNGGVRLNGLPPFHPSTLPFFKIATHRALLRAD